MTSHLTRRAVITLAAATAAVAAGGAIAAATTATTFTVKAGSAAVGTVVKVTGATTGSTPQITLTDVDTGTKATCDSGTGSGSFKVGTYAAGQTAATLTGNQLKPVNCQGPLGLKLTKFQGVGNWNLVGTSYSNGVTTGTLKNIKANIAANGTACSFTGSGSVQGTFTNSSQSVTTNAKAATLKISNVKGCYNLIANGDKATISLSLKIAPVNAAYGPITITSP